MVWLMSGDSGFVNGIDLEVSGGMTSGYIPPHDFLGSFQRYDTAIMLESFAQKESCSLLNFKELFLVFV